jgi:hypothetical protein
MPKPNRRTSLAILSLILAGCTSGPLATGTTPAPNATSAANASATGAAAATATLGTTAPPAPSFPANTPLPTVSVCSQLDVAGPVPVEADLGSVDPLGNGGVHGFSVGHVPTGLHVTSVTELFGSKRSLAVKPRELYDMRGQVLGDVEFVTFPSVWWEGHQNPQAMISAAVTLTLKGGSPLPLKTRFIPGNVNFDQVAVTVPDVSGPGTLSIELVWADPCFRYEAARTMTVDIVQRSQTVGCALDQTGYFDQVRDELSDAIHVGGSLVVAGSPFNEARYLPFSNPGIDAFILYAFDPEAPATIAEPGQLLRVENRSTAVRLSDLSYWVWTRKSVVTAVADYPPLGVVEVAHRTPSLQADGSWRLRAPTEPGRYVVGLDLTFESACSSGTAWAAMNLTVPAP